SPAMDAAMATTVPIVSAAILPASSVQPSSRKMDEVAISVAMVMPLVGLDVTPTIPTIREDTVTKKNAKIATSTAATVRPTTPGSEDDAAGTSPNASTPMAAPIATRRRE